MKISLAEFQENFKYEILKPMECVKTFNCGDEDLDNFIINESADFTKSLLSVTYIITDKNKNNVVAYFSLATDKLSLNDFASNSEFNRFRKRRFVHEKRLRSYPAVKLCRLGVDVSMKGTGLGSIIISLIEYLCTQGNRFGCRFITVDAYQTAVSFYEKNDFMPLSNKDNNSYTKMMYLDLGALSN